MAASGARERILSESIRLFASNGYSETSIDTIVGEAGVTKGAFYYYFTSKEEVLEIIHDQFLDYQLRLAEKVTNDKGAPPEKLRRMVGDLVRSIVLYRPNVAVFFQEVDRLPEERRREIEERRHTYQMHLETIIRDGIAQGSFRPDVDPVIATLGIFGLCNWTYRWLKPDGRIPLESVITMLSDMVMRGLVHTPRSLPRKIKGNEAASPADPADGPKDPR